MITHPIHIAAFLHFAGFLTGLALYGLVLSLSLRNDAVRQGAVWRVPQDPLLLGTGLLGVVWNLGALMVYGAADLGIGSLPALIPTLMFSALGYLPALAIHSILRPAPSASGRMVSRLLIGSAYGLSTVASGLQVAAAITGGHLPAIPGLRLLTVGFVGLAVPLVFSTRHRTLWRRALLLTALAVFAVSAVHLVEHHDFTSPAWIQVLGHHASLPLAVAILLQDYPFAFADLLLKRMLSLSALMVLTLALLLSLVASPLFVGAHADMDHPIVLGAMLVLATGVAVVYPTIRKGIAMFVDRVVLRRADRRVVLEEVGALAQTGEHTTELLNMVCERLARALSAASVTWTRQPATPATLTGGPAELVTLTGDGRGATVVVPTSDPPRPVIEIGPLGGGRRLLWDDIELLRSSALVLARRLDSIHFAHERFEQDTREQETLKLASEAELRALRAQINPHFLFNALTTIGYLVQTAPADALQTLLRLTDLLRRVLRSESDMVPLGDELDFVSAYLDIERARFEDRLRVEYDVPDTLRKVRVPVLLLQPLVENAIKHGIAPSRSGGTVSVSAYVEDSEKHAELVLTVANTGSGMGDPSRQRAGMGIGLANVDRRLQLAFGPAASLVLSANPPGGARAVVRIPLATASDGTTRLEPGRGDHHHDCPTTHGHR